MQKQSVMLNKTVEETIDELIKNGYNKIDAIKFVHDNYDIENKLDLISFLIHISSLVLLLSLFVTVPLVIFLKIALGTFYSIFFVGYVILKVFYSKELRQLSELQLLGLSLGVSFAVIGILGLLLNFTVGITSQTAIYSVVGITELFNLISNLRGSK
ncbi:DUF1616 domain-containing protein [Sulfolobus tengchongensis]|uniref:DUF1616 domain-containing protein n=1 Tax=Sulfolobus tengchongensis TaxID=207809 RepID=A0AAX4L165_9CREN